MKMNRMRIVGGIDQNPDLGRVEHGGFRNGLVPVRAVQQHENGLGDAIYILVERKKPRLYCLRFGSFWHGAQGCRQRTEVVHFIARNAELHYHECVAIENDLLAAMAAEVNDEINSFARRNHQCLERNRRGEESLVRSYLAERS